MTKNLTILLTLKGRYLFTLRWLWHANRIKLTFPILIADGELNSPVAHVIENRALFPNLEIQYHRYNDATFLDFYNKLDDAMLKIKTPFVMLSDNDDFLFLSGVNRSIEFLKQSIDYVCAGGAISHFEICERNDAFSNLAGAIKALWFQQREAYQAHDLDTASASERVFFVYRKNLTVWYNVYRTEAFRRITSEMVRLNFTELERSELFQKLRVASLGKIKSDRSYISYMRQIGTSTNPAKRGYLVDTLANRKYAEETQVITKKVAAAAAQNDNIDVKQIESKLENISAEQLRSQLTQLLGWRTAIKSRLKRYLPMMLFRKTRFIIDRIRSGRSSAAGGRSISRRQILEQMAGAGASHALLNDQNIEFEEMAATLNSKELLDFIRLYIPLIQ